MIPPDMNLPLDAAVYAEHSDTRKPVSKGWNTRVFNRREVQEGPSIRLDPATGVVTLGPGVYHITGCSMVTYDDLDPHPTAPGWNTELRPNAGYCRLRYAADVDCKNELAIAVGTISNANMVPSLIETYVKVAQSEEIILEHQVGDDHLDGIYLQDTGVGSTWHVFARLAIRRL